MIRAANILPETGRGTIRRMVEGLVRLNAGPSTISRRCALADGPPPRSWCFGEDDQSPVLITPFQQIGLVEKTRPLLRPQIPGRQQPRQPPPATPVARIDDGLLRIIGKHQPRSDDQPEGGQHQPLFLSLIHI